MAMSSLQSAQFKIGGGGKSNGKKSQPMKSRRSESQGMAKKMGRPKSAGIKSSSHSIKKK